LASLGGRRTKGKVVRGWIWWKSFLIKYKNGKMRPVETIPGMGGRLRRMIEKVTSTMT
jgi:hypothetical protein